MKNKTPQEIIQDYHKAIREKPDKSEFQKGIVRGLNLALQILDAHISEVEPEQFEKNEDIFKHIRHGSKFFEVAKAEEKEDDDDESANINWWAITNGYE